MKQRKKRKLNQLLCLVLSGILVLLLPACGQIRLGAPANKDYYIQIENAGCTKAEAVFLLMEEKAAYEQGGNSAGIWEKSIGGGTMADYVKEVVDDKLTRYAAAEVMSDELAAYPSEEAKNQAGEDAVTAWTRISGLYDVDSFGITAADVNGLYYKKAVYDAVYDQITNTAAAGVTEDSTRVMLADYVVVPHGDGEQPAAAIFQSIREGTEIQQAAAAAGYSALTSQMIKRGELNQTVDNIAFALVDGEWSEVIECKDGYFIIHCLDDDLLQESAANYNETLSETKENAFKEAYYEFSSGAKIWRDTAFLEQLDIGSVR